MHHKDSGPMFAILKTIARHYVSTDAHAARLAERALQIIFDDPSLLDAPNIDEALFVLVHRVAQGAFKHPHLQSASINLGSQLPGSPGIADFTNDRGADLSNSGASRIAEMSQDQQVVEPDVRDRQTRREPEL